MASACVGLACGLALASGGACKKTSKGESASLAREAVVGVEQFAADMCRCRDQACADQVATAMTAWSQRMIEAGLDTPASADDVRRREEASTRLTECYGTAFYASTAPPLDANGPAAPRNADTLIRQVYQDVAALPPAQQIVVRSLDFDYVSPDGTLDAKYGSGGIHLARRLGGLRTAVDDSSRPLGAPVEDAAPDAFVVVDATPCQDYLWSKGREYRTEGASCAAVNDGAYRRPRCTVVEVWQRAIANHAPAPALARITYEQDTWTFRIDDDPRNVHVALGFPDDCIPMLEKPR